MKRDVGVFIEDMLCFMPPIDALGVVIFCLYRLVNFAENGSI